MFPIAICKICFSNKQWATKAYRCRGKTSFDCIKSNSNGRNWWMIKGSLQLLMIVREIKLRKLMMLTWHNCFSFLIIIQAFLPINKFFKIKQCLAKFCWRNKRLIKATSTKSSLVRLQRNANRWSQRKQQAKKHEWRKRSIFCFRETNSQIMIKLLFRRNLIKKSEWLFNISKICNFKR